MATAERGKMGTAGLCKHTITLAPSHQNQFDDQRWRSNKVKQKLKICEMNEYTRRENFKPNTSTVSWLAAYCGYWYRGVDPEVEAVEV